jgi:hypothetical protein
MIMVLSVTAPGADAKEPDASRALNYPAAGATANAQTPAPCLTTNDGYLRARLTGSIQAELDWRNDATSCTGSARPGGGLRLRFSHAFGNTAHPLVLLFGINAIHAGESGKVLAVNLTIMREGEGEFYSTQGDKCTIDRLQQTVVPGMPTRKRSYRVEAHGFCNQPAHALTGNGVILVTRFDFTGRVDVDDDDDNTAAMSARS